MAQIDLFLEDPAPTFPGADVAGWERRALADLAERPRVYCYPGFMGSVCERLVAQGLATRDPCGFLAPPEGLDARKLKAWGWKSADHPLFLYTLRA